MQGNFDNNATVSLTSQEKYLFQDCQRVHRLFVLELSSEKIRQEGMNYLDAWINNAMIIIYVCVLIDVHDVYSTTFFFQIIVIKTRKTKISLTTTWNESCFIYLFYNIFHLFTQGKPRVSEICPPPLPGDTLLCLHRWLPRPYHHQFRGPFLRIWRMGSKC